MMQSSSIINHRAHREHGEKIFKNLRALCVLRGEKLFTLPPIKVI